jgi:hypothetical protein
LKNLSKVIAGANRVKKIYSVILAALIILPLTAIQANDGISWIEEYRLEDYQTGQLVLSWNSGDQQVLINAPVLAGDEYKLNFMLNVRQTVDNAVLELRLSEEVEKQSKEVFWEIQTVALPVKEDFNPAQRSIRFYHIEGVYEINVIGRIDRNLTRIGDSVVLHRPVNLTVIELWGPAQTLYDNITLTVIDEKIDDYRFLLDQKEEQIEQYRASNVDPAFIQLSENFIELSKRQAETGLVDAAINLLETMEVDAPPAQTGPSFQEKYFFPVTGALLILSIIGIVLFVRTRSKMGFKTMIVEDQIREMEALQARAQRIDRNLAKRLQEINDRLKEAERA